MLNLQTTMLGSDNPEQLSAFYGKVLGEPMMNDGGFTGWSAGNGFLMVGGHSEVKGTSAEPARIMFGFITDDVEGEFKRIEDLGGKSVAAPYRPGDDDKLWLATLADPDGNYFQLMSPWADDTDK